LNTLVLPYYVFVPGYFVTQLLHKGSGVFEKMFYTIAWSLVVVASFYSLSTLFQGDLFPINLLVPLLTLALLVYVHYRDY